MDKEPVAQMFELCLKYEAAVNRIKTVLAVQDRVNSDQLQVGRIRPEIVIEQIREAIKEFV